MGSEGVSNNLDLINGPLLLGTLFGYGLFGILVVQVFMYQYQFPYDPIWTKALVWSILIADVALTILQTIVIWDLLITGWGDPSMIGVLEWPFTGITIASGYVLTFVHVFFSWRIWKLHESCILPCIVVVISFVAWSMELFCGVQGVRLGTAGAHKLIPFVTVWLVGSTFCDIAITVTLVSVLITRGSQTGFKRLSSVIRRLIQLTMETTMITTVGAIAELVIFTTFPQNNMHLLIYFMLAKLYSNSLLTTLNARSYINTVDTCISFPLWEDQLQVTTASGPRFGNASCVPNGMHMTNFLEPSGTRHDNRRSISDGSLRYKKDEIMAVCGPDIVECAVAEY